MDERGRNGEMMGHWNEDGQTVVERGRKARWHEVEAMENRLLVVVARTVVTKHTVVGAVAECWVDW